MILYKNFFDIDLVNNVLKLFDKNSNQKNKKIVLRTHIDTQIKYDYIFVDDKLINLLESQLKQKLNFKFKTIEFQLCLWENNSKLEMHYDTMYKYGATLYLTDWNKNWGGLFSYIDISGNKKVVCPEKNLLIFSDKSERHEVTQIVAPEKRKTLQIWFK